MLRKFKFITILINIVLFLCASRGNNLTISNIGVTQDPAVMGGTVAFDLKWDNSWRTSGPGTPNNWDAVWVFIKFRKCSDPVSTSFTHGTISTTYADHTFPAGVEPVSADGTISGNAAGSIASAPDNTGIMIRRDAVGIYATSNASHIILKVTNLNPGTDGSLDVRVYGIEMVFVPQGEFALGDGTTQSATDLRFKYNNLATDNRFVLITSENATTVYNGSNQAISLPATFPKGYNAFHIMKYEISQYQYAEFLNTLTGAAVTNRYSTATYNQYRNRLKGPGSYPTGFQSDRPHRAQGYLAWPDFLAYMDWACLRPMSECEFEKACRGPLPPVTTGTIGEYAWGTTANFTGIPAAGISGVEDGTEFASTGNVSVYLASYTSGDGAIGPIGPVRCGMFAGNPANTTRISTGATYYGVMEMSGNLWEWCYKATQASASTFTRTWGDGVLDAAGNENVANWPSGTDDPIVRGGSYIDGNGATYQAYFEVSNRRFSLNTAWTAANWNGGLGIGELAITAANIPLTTTRVPYFGGRGVR